MFSRPDGSFVFYDNATSTLMAVLPWSSLLANDGATGGF